jgi:predicted RNA binding protein with dsRBD fold (UPF0201 family)
VTANPIDILKSWHVVEFFQPYTIDKKSDSQVRINKNRLADQQDNLLPWLSPIAKSQLKISNVAYYTLYIGIFDLSIVNRLCEDNLLKGNGSQYNEYEIEQRLELEGNSCFVKVSLNDKGVPYWDKLSVSSLPWALGCLNNNQLHCLTAANFQKKLQEFEDIVGLLSRHMVGDENDKIVNAKWIAQFVIELEKWAGIELTSNYSFILEWKNKKGFKNQSTSSNPQVYPEVINNEYNPSVIGNNLLGPESKEDAPVKLPMPILNSFYLDDIEYAINSFSLSQAGKALQQYLSIGYKALDLYSADGLKEIQKRVSVGAMPDGRWPSSPNHNMSLMQQYAINTTIEELSEGGLMSVNGPPGTGKTTLLRDMVAHNIVERAKKLAAFSSVKDTLSPDGLPDKILSGHEMLVASSNNSAVENISRELPLITSIDQAFSDLAYLLPVANQVNAVKKDKKLRPMGEDAYCWGNISAVLGKKANREEFCQRLFFDAHFTKDSAEERHRPSGQNFLNIWRWRVLEKQDNKSPCFETAKENFLKAVDELNNAVMQLRLFDSVRHQLDDGYLQQEISDLNKQIQKKHSEIEIYQSQQKEKEKLLVELDLSVELASRLYAEHSEEAPSLLVKIFQRRKHKAYFERLAYLEEDKKLTISRLSHVKKEMALIEVMLKERKDSVSAYESELMQKQNELTNLLMHYEKLSNSFSGMVFPNSTQVIDDHNLQRNAYWQNPEINRLRSDVFAKAMALHEAWLFGALEINEFREQVRSLNGHLSKPHLTPDPEGLWRLFFMMVPVASTTFASVGRMLGGVSEEALGWLFIDEAGQAVPSQAVGAIMRAKRVLVVGDPLQIEPVFTTSPDLVRALCEQRLGQHADEWSPLSLSVQQIADRAHRFGCKLEIMGSEQWIGIPLWVHRRCMEPMFSLSNKIAYNDRMIHGLPSDKIQHRTAFGITHHWVESKGKCNDKQYKPQLSSDTSDLICKILLQGGELNKIYIITPFKAVKEKLKDELKNNIFSSSNDLPISEKDYKSWSKSNIGTVHTFQGKENDIVIFVLGCDPENMGGAKWAGSKPNLLNVAATRAKKNLYVVGDSAVWKGVPYFIELYKCLD